MKTHRVMSLMLALALGWSAPAMGQQTAEERFQAGLYQEEVQGNLEQAVTIYQAILREYASDRAVAAKAQLHIGICYETLGRQEAQQAYQRVVTAYGDQAEVVSQARQRLAALSRQTATAASTGPVARMLLSNRDTDVNHFFDMRVSPDGRQILYTDMGYTGAVYIRDLASGDTTKVADGWAVSPIWSHDGKRIAYSTVTSWDPYKASLSVVDLETDKRSTPSALGHLNLQPIDWSPNGDLLVCSVGEDRRDRVLALVSLSTGDTTTLAGAQWDLSADFSPDGRYVAFSDAIGGNTDVYVMDVETGERHRITVNPEMEGRPRWSPRGDVLVYIAANSGTWGVPMRGGVPSAAARLLTSQRYDQPAGWTTAGDYYYVQHNRARQPLGIPVDQETMTAAGPPEPLPVTQTAIGTLSWSSDMRRIASGSWDAIQVYSFEDQQLRAYKVGPDHRTPTAWWSADGSMIYFSDVGTPEGVTLLGLDLSSGAVRELFSRRKKVSRLRPSNDGRKMVFYLYSGDSDASEMQLVVSDLGDWNGVVLADERKMTDGRLARWVRPQLSPDGSQLLYGTQGHEVGGTDARYQLWVTSADGSSVPRQIAAAHWIPYAAWHPAGTHVVYDTWEEDETGSSRLWVVNVQTGERHEIVLPAGLEGLEVHQWSPDGRWIGVVNATSSYELWVVENVLGDRVEGARRQR